MRTTYIYTHINKTIKTFKTHPLKTNITHLFRIKLTLITKYIFMSLCRNFNSNVYVTTVQHEYVINNY